MNYGGRGRYIYWGFQHASVATCAAQRRWLAMTQRRSVPRLWIRSIYAIKSVVRATNDQSQVII